MATDVDALPEVLALHKKHRCVNMADMRPLVCTQWVAYIRHSWFCTMFADRLSCSILTKKTCGVFFIAKSKADRSSTS